MRKGDGMINEVVHQGNLSRVTKLYDNGFPLSQRQFEVCDQCDCGIIVLGGSTALVDYNGPRPPDEEIIDEREKITGKRVRYIFLTPAHADHGAGFPNLEEEGMQMLSLRACSASSPSHCGALFVSWTLL